MSGLLSSLFHDFFTKNIQEAQTDGCSDGFFLRFFRRRSAENPEFHREILPLIPHTGTMFTKNIMEEFLLRFYACVVKNTSIKNFVQVFICVSTMKEMNFDRWILL
ncbi:hypothetical protein CSA56_12155 [candidate division KSB3 bacterium]|uniref:Uncharacterized protein n=1 Tax=candidate division KSB3 bacterium TaxID=2044937 RepID=A0A2G6KCD1_9BACT|nr:MAG: hypothetical protein CSA56_12155 [candidate division KSB3 bacterium]